MINFELYHVSQDTSLEYPQMVLWRIFFFQLIKGSGLSLGTFEIGVLTLDLNFFSAFDYLTPIACFWPKGKYKVEKKDFLVAEQLYKRYCLSVCLFVCVFVCLSVCPKF